jgi:hypothetical protein
MRVRGGILKERMTDLRLVNYESGRFLGVAESRVQWLALMLTLLPMVMPEGFVIPKVTARGTGVFCEPKFDNSESRCEGIRMVVGACVAYREGHALLWLRSWPNKFRSTTVMDCHCNYRFQLHSVILLKVEE